MFCQLLTRSVLGSRIMMRGAASHCGGGVSLSVSPRVALVDEPVRVRVTGLHAHQPVTIAAAIKESGCFISHSHYTADGDGVVDLTQASSQGGTYTGQEPMGLFWSMVPGEGERPGSRLMKRDATSPFYVQMQVRGGHVRVSSEAGFAESSGVLASELAVERWYLAAGVRRIPVRHGNIRGTLFLPQGPGPFPGVIDMFGTAGGLAEFRAALLASRGFAAMALAYFAYDDLPKVFSFNLEYFEEAVDYLSSHPQVKKPGIGVLGVSMGSDLACYMATTKKQVIACVGINGFFFYSTGLLFKGGEPFPSALPDVSKLEKVAENAYSFQPCYIDPEGFEDAAIKFEKAGHCEFLLVHGEADSLSGPHHRDRQVERFRRHGCSNFRLLSYPGAGHLLEPPYTPLSTTPFHKQFNCLVHYGGEPVEHARAQEQSWREILEFLHQRLDKQTPLAKL